MSCPLPFSKIRSVLTRIPARFDTLEFIEACPNSGRTASGSGCRVVRAGSRAACGKGVAEFARAFPKDLERANTGSPARWKQVQRVADEPEFFDAVGSEPEPDAVRPGHISIAEWLGTDDFKHCWSVHEAAVGTGNLYYRPTDAGVVMVVLVKEAPCLVGFRTSQGDAGHMLRPGMAPPSLDEVKQRWEECLRWLGTVRRESDEERGVAEWIGTALRQHLILPELGQDWVFLNQEWRFLMEYAKGKKSDVLAVHLPSGTLGMVEFKDARSKRGEALEQLRLYRRLWRRDTTLLAPLFTKVIQAQGTLYGNERATKCTITTEDAVTFFGIARPGRIAVERVSKP